MASAKTRVAVLFGGRSSEHEVSVTSATSIIATLDRDRFEVIPISIGRAGRWLSPADSASLLPDDVAKECLLAPVSVLPAPEASEGFDVVFPALHGPFGEDGRIQGLLDLASVPYVGSGVLASACAMDKDVTKRMLRERGIPVLPWVIMRGAASAERVREIEGSFGYPAFVKPANLGSSVGVRKVDDRDQLLAAIKYASEFDPKVLVEPGVSAREIECAVLGNEDPQASLPAEIVTSDGFYDYETKYETDTAQLVVPASLDRVQADEIRRMAVDAFVTLGCSGLARVDFFLDKVDGRIVINEVNTMPGFTSISLYPRMWTATGVPYPRLLERLIDLAFERHERASRVRYDAE